MSGTLDGGALDVGGTELIELRRHANDLGVLIASEQLPFAAKRMFTVQGVPAGEFRGWHAHRACEQLLVCLSGSVIALVDDGATQQEVLLDDPTTALYMPPMTWGRQRDYSSDAVLLVLASHDYDRADYIEDRDEFLALARPRT